MTESPFIGLVENVSLLLALVLIFNLVEPRLARRQAVFRQVFLGVLVGAIGVGIMLIPWVLVPGANFDTRSVLLSISGLFFGPLPTLIAMAMTVTLRIYQGGSGALTGVLVILSTGTLGLVWRKMSKHPLEQTDWKELYLFGLITHLMMLALMLTFPREIVQRVLDTIGLPVLAIYPLGTVLLGTLMVNEERRKQAKEEITASNRKWQATFDGMNDSVFLLDDKGVILQANQASFDLFGKKAGEIVGKYCYEVVHNATCRIEGCPFVRMEQSKQRETMVLQIGEKWLDVTVDPLLDNNGRLQGAVHIITDITERKRMEKVLQESEDRYHAMFEQAGDGVFILDTHGKIISINETFARMHGFTVEELLSMGLDGLDVEGTVPVPERIRRIMAGETLNFEVEHYHKDGYTFPLAVTSNLISSGSEQLIIAFHRDITERKRAEAALRESEERFRKAFTISPDSININRLNDGMYVSINNGFTQIMGYTADDIIGKTSIEMNIWVDPEDRKKLVEGLVKNKEVANLEARFRTKNGDIRDGLMSASVASLNGVAHIISITRDITDRKRAEKKIAASEAELRALFASMQDVVLVIDRDGVYRKIAPTNPVLLVQSPEKLLGKNLRDVFPAEQAEAFLGATRRVLETLQIARIEYELTIGERRPWFSASISPMDEDCTVWVARDITEGKQAEEEIRQLNANLEQRVEERTRELREAQEQLVRQEKLAVLGQLAGGVGHELRNPLAVIVNAVYFLKLVQPGADEKIKEYLGIIERETHNAEMIITDLLDFARVQSAEREPVSVSKLVRQTLERFPAPASVEVTLEIPPGLPNALADPRQMTQVLGNLTVNACQAMPKGGELVISVQCSAISENTFIAISVRDSGVGITPENMRKLFEPLFTTKPKGIGLGLAVSRKLAEANGGRIEVQSEPGVGSTFTLWLPIQAGHP